MIGLKIGPLDISAGGLYVKRGRFLLPDGLHIWFRDRGLHMYWSHSDLSPRIVRAFGDE